MKTKQISTFIENKTGRLHAACEALSKNGINIHTLSLADTSDFGILRLIVADPAAARAALEDAGYVVKETDVLAVEVLDDAGGLSAILAQADDAALGIEYMYAFSTASGKPAIVIIRFSEPDRAVTELQQRGINVIEAVKLLQD